MGDNEKDPTERNKGQVQEKEADGEKGNQVLAGGERRAKKGKVGRQTSMLSRLVLFLSQFRESDAVVSDVEGGVDRRHEPEKRRNKALAFKNYKLSAS